MTRLNTISEATLQSRRERVFLFLTAIFLGTLTMLNILGISRFIDFSFELFGLQIPFSVAVGVLPYPVTFLCTDLISELYGKRRANWVVWIGLVLNVWVVFVLWIGGVLPGFEEIEPATGELVRDAAGRLPVFFEVRQLTFGSVAASMIAYLTAQLCDVKVFHWLKKITSGRHLWLRNNVSTMTSQMVDTVAVILITHYFAGALPIETDSPVFSQLLVFIASGYVFKMVVALLDTIPAYGAVMILSKYLRVDSREEEPVGGGV